MKHMNNKGVVMPTPSFFSLIFHDIYKKEGKKKHVIKFISGALTVCEYWWMWRAHVFCCLVMLCKQDTVHPHDRKSLQSLSWDFPSFTLEWKGLFLLQHPKSEQCSFLTDLSQPFTVRLIPPDNQPAEVSITCTPSLLFVEAGDKWIISHLWSLNEE